MRSLALTLAILLASGRAIAEPTWIPETPEPKPAPYVSPLVLLEGLPAGTVRVDGEDVCLDPAASARMSVVQDVAEELSHQRASLSWSEGWTAGAGAMLPRLEEERAARLEAEALASVGDSNSTTLLTSIASAAGALAIGVLLGAYVVH